MPESNRTPFVSENYHILIHQPTHLNDWAWQGQLEQHGPADRALRHARARASLSEFKVHHSELLSACGEQSEYTSESFPTRGPIRFRMYPPVFGTLHSLPVGPAMFRTTLSN